MNSAEMDHHLAAGEIHSAEMVDFGEFPRIKKNPPFFLTDKHRQMQTDADKSHRNLEVSTLISSFVSLMLTGQSVKAPKAG